MSFFFVLRRLAPENEEGRIGTFAQSFNDGVGEGFPALAAMRVRLMRSPPSITVLSNSTPLFGPWSEATILRWRDAEVVVQLLEDIAQRSRELDGRAVRKNARPCAWPTIVIRILAEDDDAHRIERPSTRTRCRLARSGGKT